MKELHLLPPGERGMKMEQLRYEYDEQLRMLRETQNVFDPGTPLHEVNKTTIIETDFSK